MDVHSCPKYSRMDLEWVLIQQDRNNNIPFPFSTPRLLARQGLPRPNSIILYGLELLLQDRLGSWPFC